MEAIGTNKLDANSLMKYFEPLIGWLEEQNANETLGWPDFNWVPPIPEGYPEDIGKDCDYTYCKGIVQNEWKTKSRIMKNINTVLKGKCAA